MKLLTLARDLRRRKSREKHSLFVAEGIRSVEEVLRSSVKLRGVLVAPQLASAPRGVALRAALDTSGTEVNEVSENDFRSAAETDSPQGVLAIGEVPAYSLDTLDLPNRCRLVVLDGVQDPGNVGTILRTAAAFGAHATLALPGTVDIWNAKTIRSSMGAQFHHPAFHAAPSAVARFFEARQVTVWAAAMGGDLINGDGVPDRLAIAFGNEGAGLSSEVRAMARRIVSLPIAPAIESLNVAVAAGIILYELRL